MGTVIVLGSLITDLVARAPRLPLPGESLIGDEFGTFLGGKGFNQAVAAARFGANVSLIARVGTDTFGDAFFAAFEHERIKSTYVTRDSANGSGVACVMIAGDSGQNAIVVLPQANFAITATMVEEALHALLAEQQISSGIFMAQCEMRMATVAAGLRLAHAAGLITMFNTAPVPREPIADDLFTVIDILVVNETEAASLTHMPVGSLAQAQAAAEALLTKGAQHIITTLGAQGFVWSTRESESGRAVHQKMRALPVRQVDATAAGDAFCGVLAAKLAEGIPMEEALRWANAAGAVTVTRMGALPSLPTADEVGALLREQRA